MGYWEQRHGEILASANESTTSGEETAWLDGHRALEQARSNAENSYQRVSSTTLLGTMSHGAFLQAIGQFRDAVAARAVAFQTGRDAAGLATTAITTLRGSGAGAPGLAEDPGTFETIAGEEVEDTAAREAAWRSGRTAYNTSVAEREEYFRQRVLAFEEGMYLSAEKYAQIDPRIPASSSPGGSSGSSGSSGSIAPASSRASLSGYEVGGGRADVVGIDRDPGQPTEPTAPIDPTIPPPDWDGGPGPTTPVGPIEAGIQPGVGGGGGLVSGIGAGAAGIAAGLGLVRALRNGSLGGAAPATAGRGSALTRGALGRSGGASVPPSQAGRGGGGTGVGRNGALGRGPGAPVSGSRGTRSSLGGNPVTGGRSAGGAGAGRGAGAPAAGRSAAAGKGAAAPSGSRGTRTSLGGQSPAASRPGGAAGGAGAAGRGGAAAAGGKGGAGGAGGTAKGKGANGVSGSRGTRTSLGAGALGGRRGGGSQEDEKPQKIELYESDDWIDDEPSGPSVLR
ncbi:hypothetical protein RDV89_08205 [Nocardioides zeae]|uniref:PPE domain-containing protein n=1 Tax=Nocardioides imazamoxiresistens TaxID=3231893 RepID=A0ABU3PVY7_9ACTN|nr:hypothetical protein [Nocardioides zeae]MDT9593046.1 hypothetical protein [Nocardioides zeae]